METSNVYRFDGTTVASQRQKIHRKANDGTWGIRAKALVQQFQEQRKAQALQLESSFGKSVDSIQTFLDKVRSNQPNGKLAAGFVQIGPSSDAFTTVLARLTQRLGDSLETGCGILSLKSGDASTLKRLVDVATVGIAKGRKSANSAEEDADNARRHFCRVLKEKGVKQVVYAFEDSEALDIAVLAGFLEILQLWAQSMSFVLLYGVRTSVDNFRSKLPWSCAKALQTIQHFDLTRATVSSQDFRQAPDQVQLLDLQPSQGSAEDNMSVANHALQIKEYKSFAHYYTNDLTVFLTGEAKYDQLSDHDFQALRNLPSFQMLVEHDLKDTDDAKHLRSLMTDNITLFEFTSRRIGRVQPLVVKVQKALSLLRIGFAFLSRDSDSMKALKRSELLAGGIANTEPVQRLIALVRRASYEQIGTMLRLVMAHVGDIDTTKDELIRLQEHYKDSKFENGSPAKDQLSVVPRLTKWLSTFFNDAFVDLRAEYPIELFIIEPVPIQRAFSPQTRGMMETALLQSELYLVDPADPILSADSNKPHHHSPPTAILFQLLLETGPLVNVADWWAAFQSMYDDSEIEERTIMALFQQGLAELSFLGVIRSSRRKADHVTRTFWEGL